MATAGTRDVAVEPAEGIDPASWPDFGICMHLLVGRLVRNDNKNVSKTCWRRRSSDVGDRGGSGGLVVVVAAVVAVVVVFIVVAVVGLVIVFVVVAAATTVVAVLEMFCTTMRQQRAIIDAFWNRRWPSRVVVYWLDQCLQDSI